MINIAIAPDNNYVNYAIVMLKSLFSNIKEDVTIYVLYNELSEKN